MISDSSGADNNPVKKTTFINRLKKSFKKSNNDVLESCDYESLDLQRKEMIRGIIKLPVLNARDIMIPRVDVFAVDSETDLKPLVKTMCKAGHSRVPVYKETIDNIVGILYVKDLLRLLIETSRKKFQLKRVIHEPFFVPETMTLDELLVEFKMRKLHIAVVVDEYGGFSGIVTLEDILEEIVGEINDEFDSVELPEIEKTGKNTYEIDSRMPIADFNEKLGLALTQDGFDTVGGYVFDLFGKIPEKGESIRDGNIIFTIKEINGTVINRIIVTINKSK
ncbi:MAG TPA: hemolysin family protein [Spirochaetota bacterium]|nr:hemolysin family protein [Spirochaetota bacterium]HRS75605.1 hemolysin family protein [Spirochaetota bacterium]